MSDNEEHRYLFTVRQRFDESPIVDAFYELTVPPGVTTAHAEVMVKLNENWCAVEMKADTAALNGMQLRLRFNSDMYNNVCMVRTQSEITAETLNDIIAMKSADGALMEFLNDSAI